ncbi:uncharacterized protein TNCV_648251 [Trichonephila clavipes]|uniref:Uncharacterized protein n=1 Tax=Trichonephila clavipes TaxID=2585209 RepID=A0A8X6VDV4_TRICX|nr:uncharacterized protein TNCV_648251 [Trichonephila clavipes]
MHKKSFVKERKRNLSASPVKKVTKKNQKNIANLLNATAKSSSEYMREYRARKKNTAKYSLNGLLILSLRNGNAIETLLMTAQINTDLVNHPVTLTTEPSTSLVSFETDACKSIINSFLRYKDYNSLKNAHKDFQKRFVDNRSFYDRF